MEAYREAIVNSIIHFDYFLGDTIAIEKLKSSIVINNKGELLFPESDFGKRSEARNRLLVDLLARTDFMEKAGTGVKRVSDACTENGNKVEFRFTDAFWITLYSNKNVTVKVTDKVTNKVTDKVTDNQSLILQYIIEREDISTRDLAEMVGISQRKVKENIAKLKVLGILKRIGPPKGGHWQVLEN